MFKIIIGKVLPWIILIYPVTQTLINLTIGRYVWNSDSLKKQILTMEKFIKEDVPPGDVKRLEEEETIQFIYYHRRYISLREARKIFEKNEDRISTLVKYSPYHKVFHVE